MAETVHFPALDAERRRDAEQRAARLRKQARDQRDQARALEAQAAAIERAWGIQPAKP